ncbi:MAG: HNH endonuclease signature motif containing protein [Bacteroidales bacterium]|nr:HNH endonuclease signature motif containing protein [Bacteroidales bacterium]
MKWIKIEMDYLKRNYARTCTHQLADRLMRTSAAVKSKAITLGLRKEFQQPISVWTQTRDILLTNLYQTHTTTEIAQELHLSISAIKNRVQMLGLKKKGNSGRFVKGCIPVNKGKKISADVYAKCAPTMFKKGHTPANHRVVGSERVNVEGYVEIKIKEPNKWDLKHRVIWRMNYGDIPQGANVQFKDGNRQNCELDNLYLIFRSEQILQNSILRYPPELQKTIKLLSKLTKTVKKNDKAN